MSRREVFFLIGHGDAILWSDASSSPVALPDSRARWEAIWRHREALSEIGVGSAVFHPEASRTAPE